LVQAPIFTAVVIITLGLGSGPTGLFSVLNALVFRELPVEKPEQLVKLFTAVKRQEGFNDFNYPDYVELRDHNQVFSGLLGNRSCGWAEPGGGGERAGLGRDRDRQLFRRARRPAGARPHFLPEEDRNPNEHPVTVLSDSLWRRRFGSDPKVVGSTVKLNGFPFTVIGSRRRASRDQVRAGHGPLAPMMMREESQAVDRSGAPREGIPGST